MSESECRADVSKNRLYLRLSGFFREAEVVELFRQLTGELDKLRNGFDVVVDMATLKPGSPEAAAIVHKAGELLRARGRRHGVWITGASPTTLLQFKRELGGMFEPDSIRTAGRSPKPRRSSKPGTRLGFADRDACRAARGRFVDTLPRLPVHSPAR